MTLTALATTHRADQENTPSWLCGGGAPPEPGGAPRSASNRWTSTARSCEIKCSVGLVAWASLEDIARNAIREDDSRLAVSTNVTLNSNPS